MYKFTEDCFTGIDQIDEEHRQLFSMLNEGMELLEKDGKTAMAAAKNLIPTLCKYAENHFAHEEEYMAQINDRELPRQKQEHAQFEAYVRGFDLTSFNEENSKTILGELLQYLAHWLYHHILGSDMMIGYNIAENPEDAFAFTDKYKTGIALIDEEHRQLFEIIRKTNDAIHAELLHDKFDIIVNIINELRAYTIMHFHDEEEYMEKIHYEGLAAQKFAHEAFVEKMKAINFDEVDENQQEYLEELVAYLLDWLSNHILKMDKRIPLP